jgi:hypothetical protein
VAGVEDEVRINNRIGVRHVACFENGEFRLASSRLVKPGLGYWVYFRGSVEDGATLVR